MTRILVHAGFHKTGTSSLQRYLLNNRAALAPWIAYYGKRDFLAVGTAARAYGRRPFPWRLRLFRRRFREFLRDLPDPPAAPAPTIVISRETLAGSMPGNPDWRGRILTGYAPRAGRLARAIVLELRARFGAEAQIAFLFTVRDGEDWVKSVYGHLLRSIELKEDYRSFRARFPPHIDLAAEAEQIAGAVAPVPVMIAALEDFGPCRLGPAEAVLDHAGVPQDVRAGLPPASRENVANAPALRAEFLDINRSGAPRRRIRAAKARLIGDGDG